MLPTTGPFTKTMTLPGPPNKFGFVPTYWWKQTTSSRQHRPYNLNLPYVSYTRQVIDYVTQDYYDQGLYTSIENACPVAVGIFPGAYNRAYGKLVSDLGDASLWAVNAVEWRQSVDLIAKDGLTLLKFAKKLNKFDFVGAARVLKTQIPKGLRATAKSFGNNFLKFHFGWEPLVNDIGAAVNTIQNPIRSKAIKGRGRTQNQEIVRADFGNPAVYGVRTTTYTYYTSCQIGCMVKVDNPNLYLASQLGFVNPVSVAWELVPFSFVVDWFANVGQFLAQYSDFAGTEVSQIYVTYFQHIHLRDTHTAGSPFVSPNAYNGNYITHYVTRTTPGSLPGVTLRAAPLKAPSPVRAATAISLLVQQLR